MVTFFKNPRFDFIGKRKIAFGISTFFILLGIISIIAHKGLRYGVDFTGGNLVQIKFEKPYDVGKLRQILLQDANLKSIEIQTFGEPSTFLLRYKEKYDADELAKLISQKTGLKVIVERNESVGPRVGKELQIKALEALTIGLLLMLIYIWIRFDFAFGVGSVLALFHDVFITLGLLSLFNREITIQIVAALLTIVGYSINDSIVVSDRIREELRKYSQGVSLKKLVDIFNSSINATLSRTVITSLTTLIVLLAILLFGGPVIFDFSLALTIGVVVGTYSSIFVVAALVIEWRLHKIRKTQATKS